MMQLKIGLLAITAIALITAENRPNIVFILTDDQDLVFGGMEPMEKTRDLIGSQGATFENAFVSTPICCPSRSSILTGLFIHNHNTTTNSVQGGCSSKYWQDNFEPRTYGKHLNDAGYRTFYAGKYLNAYGKPNQGGPGHIPPGWDWWVGLVGNSVYYNYNISVNGTAVHHGNEESDYLTDVLRNHAISFLNNSFVTSGDQPFLMVVSTPAAHSPFRPAPRHKGIFDGINAPRTPHFNIPATDSKHWLLRMPPAILPQDVVDTIDAHYRNRWETLLAVDELVEDVIQKLEETGVLENTYIIFTSDHGFHFGQYGQPWSKRLPYEFDIRVPMLVRGPGVEPGLVIKDPVVSIDIAPTLMEMGGINLLNETDGTSFLPILLKAPSEEFDRTFLVEYQGELTSGTNPCWDDPGVSSCTLKTACKCLEARNNTYVCIRHLSNYKDDIFCRFEDDEDFTELYDLIEDPYELENLSRPSPQRDVVPYLKQLACYDKIINSKESIRKCF